MPQYAESRIVPFAPEQMWDLVIDVERYPQFLPWCVATHIHERTETLQMAEMVIGFGPFRESFISRNTIRRPEFIKVRYEQGPFRFLRNDWHFSADPRGCKVDFWIDFEFRSRLLQAAIGVVFAEATRRMVNAFLQRARVVYGTGTTALVRPLPPPGTNPERPLVR